MPVIDLYSKRQKRLRGEIADVFAYDAFSGPFRTQLSLMVDDLLGEAQDYNGNAKVREAYDAIVGFLRKEYGSRRLGRIEWVSGHQELHDFIESETDVERVLDSIELCYEVGDMVCRDRYYKMGRSDPDAHVDACVGELNARFKEAGLGYELAGDKIIRIDSQLIHAEVVKPAIGFLNVEGFEGARDEFLGAYEHYRHGDHEEALVDALKAFESTMKIILTDIDAPFDPNDTASKLVLACSKAGVIPSYNEQHLTSLTNVLTSGIPTVRNRNGGHGQGVSIRTVEPETVAYGLHLTASAIVMLAATHARSH